jgi:predicted  nucleic acid-binding Zn-ribbon protein
VTAPAFEALLALQEIDTALDQVRHRRQHLPARAELLAVTKERAALDSRARSVVEARDEVARRQRRLEDELSSTEQRSKEVTTRLYGGVVTASRELQALAADLEQLKARASDLEDGILAVLDEREPLDQAVSAVDASGAALDQREAAATVEVAEGERAADAEAASLSAQREEAAAGVSGELLAVYDRLRPRLGGQAVARLVGTHCGGCHLEMPATEIDHLRHMPAEEIAYCDQCGRILVRP